MKEQIKKYSECKNLSLSKCADEVLERLENETYLTYKFI